MNKTLKQLMIKAFSVPLIVMLIIAFTGCSKEESLFPKFKAESDSWIAEIDQKLYIDQNIYFQINYTFKGKREDMKQIDKITFSEETALDKQVVILKDKTVTPFSKNDNKQFKEITEDIKNKEGEEFKIQYLFSNKVKGENTFDIIRDSGLELHIEWQQGNKTYKEELK